MQIEMYNPEYLNLSEFIEVYDLEMILNNNLVENDFEIYFEIDNYDKLLDSLIEDVKETPEDYICLDGSTPDPKDINDIIEEYCQDHFHEMLEVYQYYIINERDAELWDKYTNYPIFYNSELDIFLVGITHYGMSWSFFFTTAERPQYKKIEEYDKIKGVI